MNLNEFSKEIWENNYKHASDYSYDDTIVRVATGVASIEKDKSKWIKEFSDLMRDFRFLPGGRILANISSNYEENQTLTLLNCTAWDPSSAKMNNPDSLEKIYDALKIQAQTLKTEAGYGMNFSHLRPFGSYVRGMKGRTPGVLKFMELWDKSSEIITAGAPPREGSLKSDEKKKIRKGAMLGVLDIWHPDIEDFIKAKQKANTLTKFNISVGITEGFMEAVMNDSDWELKFPDTTHEKYSSEWKGDIYDWESKNLPVIVFKKLKATYLWDLIAKSTYNRNEPGVLFLDNANLLSPTNYIVKIRQANPCGEIVMPTGSCALSTLNLVKYFDKSYVDNFNYIAFKKDVARGVRFLDNILDITSYPHSDYKTASENERRIGLGTMGFGSLCLMNKISYGSLESRMLASSIMKCKCETELQASAMLGAEKGSFLYFNKDEYFNTYWWKNLDIDEGVKRTIEKIGCMRNSCHSSSQPNGNTSSMAEQVSSGVEPVFNLEYIRWSIVSPGAQESLKEQGLKLPDIIKNEWFETEHLKFVMFGNEQCLEGSFNGTSYRVDRNRGLIKKNIIRDYGYQHLLDNNENIEQLKTEGLLKTTSDLEVKDHLSILEIFAHYINQAISKTVNVPKDYPYENFKNVYFEAWKKGIKGITTYRESTMSGVLEHIEEAQEKVEIEKNELEDLFIKANGNVITDLHVSLPSEYYSKGYEIKDGNKKKWYINVAFADSKLTKPFAIFVSSNVNTRETGEVASETVNAMVALAMAKGIKKELIDGQVTKMEDQTNVIKIARGIGLCLRHNVPLSEVCEVLENGKYPLSSLPFHLKHILSQFIKDGTKVSGKTCPVCGSSLQYTEGCKRCTSCDWTACG